MRALSRQRLQDRCRIRSLWLEANPQQSHASGIRVDRGVQATCEPVRRRIAAAELPQQHRQVETGYREYARRVARNAEQHGAVAPGEQQRLAGFLRDAPEQLGEAAGLGGGDDVVGVTDRYAAGGDQQVAVGGQSIDGLPRGGRVVGAMFGADAPLRAPANCGATVQFLGTVRDHHAGRTVTGIRYHAYRPLAEAQLARLESACVRRFEIERCAIAHAVGELRVGDASVAIACWSAHREQAFAACRWAIDTLKATVPIWKQERYADGQAAFLPGTPMRAIEP